MEKEFDPVKEFYENYDETIVKVCRPYQRFIFATANSVPSKIESICELGIGTGNLSLQVRNLFPGAEITGIDHNRDFTKQAAEKVRKLNVIHGNVFQIELPSVDFYVSSLTMHHLEPELQRRRLSYIAEKARYGFTNFDLILPGSRDKEEIVREVVNYAKNHLPPSAIPKIREEVMTKDHPMTIDDHRKTFQEKGYEFSVLMLEFPFAVYKVTKS